MFILSVFSRCLPFSLSTHIHTHTDTSTVHNSSGKSKNDMVQQWRLTISQAECSTFSKSTKNKWCKLNLGLVFRAYPAFPTPVSRSPVHPNSWHWLCFDSDYFDALCLFFQVWISGFAVFIPVWFSKVLTRFYLDKMYTYLIWEPSYICVFPCLSEMASVCIFF